MSSAVASVRFLGPDTDAYVASVQRHSVEFEEQTGIALEVRIVPSDLYFSNKIHHLLEGEAAADVYMSGPVLVWEHFAAGFVQPLEEFLGRSSESYDAADFVERLLACNRWSGRFGDPLGQGPLLEIPVNCESYNLAYVPAVLEAAGLDVPTTWAEYFTTARTVVERTGGRVGGFGQRGTGAWHTMYTGFATQFWSYGASDFEAGRCAIAAPASIRATSDFLAALRDSGPPNWPDQRWYELALDFAHGRYALLVDSDHYVAYFEDPALSKLVGEIGYAPPPLGPTGSCRPNLWTWSVVMNSRVRDPDAAWQFVEWATGKEFLLRSVFEGNMNPTRSSIWDDERFRQHTSGWGSFHDVARTLIERDAFVLVTPAANYLEIANRWVQALLQAYTEGDKIADALERAAADIDQLVTSAR
ncbi:MAG: multiple sugar transport system substrate-binding protein [Gaiellaceae bacterium]|nr:multiple sugar transport system substrate-binding protein [Gaiellaceae bacterium]